MATTALKIIKDGNAQRLKFMTVVNEGFIDVDIYHCDEAFMPVGVPAAGVDERNEEAYHKALRKEASQRGQFVPEESTDPEWNTEL